MGARIRIRIRMGIRLRIIMRMRMRTRIRIRMRLHDLCNHSNLTFSRRCERFLNGIIELFLARGRRWLLILSFSEINCSI